MARYRGFDDERLETSLPDEVVVEGESRLELLLMLFGVLAILLILAFTQPT